MNTSFDTYDKFYNETLNALNEQRHARERIRIVEQIKAQNNMGRSDFYYGIKETKAIANAINSLFSRS